MLVFIVEFSVGGSQLPLGLPWALPASMGI